MAKPNFTKKVIGRLVNDFSPSPMNLFSAVGDINGDGTLDVAVCGRAGRMVWLENKGPDGDWVEHLIDDEIDQMECGGSLYDLTGNGVLDIVNGGDWRCDEIYWWENPGTPGEKWKKRLVAKTGHAQFHDTIIGDVTGDGVISLIFTNQLNGGTNIYRIPLPEDPTISPWPDMEAIATGRTEPNPFRSGGQQPEEGLAIGDVDGDGKNELVCGTYWYKYTDAGWVAHKFATGYITTKVAIGDIDGDGRNEIVLSEGDPCVYGRMQGGKVGWFKPNGDVTELWKEHCLADGLLDAHTLQLGDICGNGHLDILVGEVGVAEEPPKVKPTMLQRILKRFGKGNRTSSTPAKGGLTPAPHIESKYAIRLPKVLVFENDGAGKFEQHLVDEGTGLHDGVLVDLSNRGVLDIVGKPLNGPEKWNVHVWYGDRSSLQAS